MHRKLWARLLSCVLALSVVLAAVPKPAQAVYYVVGDGGSYALMEYFRHRWPDAGYKIWTDYPQEFRAIISNGGNAFINYSQRWVGMDYLIGKYGVQEPEDMGTNSAEVLSQLNAARQAFDDAWAQYQETNKPYQPGGIGGGSSSGGDEPGGDSGVVPPVENDLMTLTLHPQAVSSSYQTNSSYNTVFMFQVTSGASTTSQRYDFNPNGSYGYPSPSSVDVVVGSNVYSVINEGIEAGKDVVVMFGSMEGTRYMASDNFALKVIPVDSGEYTISEATNYSDWGLHYTGAEKSIKLWYFNTSTQVVDNKITMPSNKSPNSTTLSTNAYSKFNHPGVWYAVYKSSSGGGTGGTVSPVPDPSTIEKPESPASPTNPQTPERDSPTIVIGGTTQTVPDPSPAPDLSTIEELLRRILANTNTIIEQMNSFSSQLGQELADFYDAVYDWFGVIDTRLRDQIALLDSEIQWLEGIFDWSKNIDTDIQYLQSVCQNGFNDVTAWLRNIFNRMVQGNGGGSKPGIVDPTDPSPVTDWLRQLWTSFLADLQMVLPDQVGAVVDFLDQLRQKFPFSIPWDIAAMLALLNHSPVTPVVDIPWGYAGGIQYVHVDCYAWDDAVEIVRPMFLLLFALGLALLTRELLAGLEAVL